MIEKLNSLFTSTNYLFGEKIQRENRAALKYRTGETHASAYEKSQVVVVKDLEQLAGHHWTTHRWYAYD
jgi:hypothetical protein